MYSQQSTDIKHFPALEDVGEGQKEKIQIFKQAARDFDEIVHENNKIWSSAVPKQHFALADNYFLQFKSSVQI